MCWRDVANVCSVWGSLPSASALLKKRWGITVFNTEYYYFFSDSTTLQQQHIWSKKNILISHTKHSLWLDLRRESRRMWCMAGARIAGENLRKSSRLWGDRIARIVVVTLKYRNLVTISLVDKGLYSLFRITILLQLSVWPSVFSRLELLDVYFSKRNSASSAIGPPLLKLTNFAVQRILMH